MGYKDFERLVKPRGVATQNGRMIQPTLRGKPSNSGPSSRNWLAR
jgi:hypothetical protein